MSSKSNPPYDDEREHHRHSNRSRSRDDDHDNDNDRYSKRHNSDYKSDRSQQQQQQQKHQGNYSEQSNHHHSSNRRHGSGDSSYYKGSSATQQQHTQEPTHTILIRGLSPKTTEPVLYHALSNWELKNIRLMAHRDTAGSHGDMSAPQLIIDSRAVMIDYAQDYHDRQRSSTTTTCGGGGGGGGGGDRGGDRGGSSRGDDRGDTNKRMRSDWMCDACGCQNFARRNECYRCNLPKNEQSVDIAAVSNDPFGETTIFSETPSTFLAVKGFSPLVQDEQLAELFRQFAMVKSVFVVRDPANGFSRGVGFVEFFSEEHALYTVRNAVNIKLDRNTVKIGFARSSFIQMHLGAQQANMYALAMMQQQAQQQLQQQYALPPINYSAMNVGTSTIGATPMYGYPPMTAPIQSYLPTTGVLNSMRGKPLFPPPFETNGGAYVFQAHSGCFFEPSSEYYYCPKSKLYYNSIEGLYFKLNPLVDPPFSVFTPSLPFESNITSTVSTTMESLPVERKPVVMSLGFKSAAAATSGTGVKGQKPPKMSAKVVQDMSKWTARQRELAMSEEETHSTAALCSVPAPVNRDEDKVAELKIPTLSTTAVISAAVSINDTSTAASIATTTLVVGSGSTVKPEVIACLLCRRKFNTSEQLIKHEKESQLHADNLAAKAGTLVAAVGKEMVPGPVYRDRASERRAVHGSADIPIVNTIVRPDPIIMSSISTSSINSSAGAISSYLSSTVVQPAILAASSAVAIGSDNTGNVLLKKLGWEEGESLGKDNAGLKVPIGLESAQMPRDKAGLGTSTDVYQLSGSSIEYGGGPNSYRKSVKDAARARFDQLIDEQRK